MNIFFSGIGGFGIGPLAMLASDAGHTVAGSDSKVSPMTEELKAQGIPIYPQDLVGLKDFHRDHPLEMFVYTSALKEDNPELVFARSQGIKTAKRDELINAIIADNDLKLIAIAGTHGKTTTTAMIIWLMKMQNLDCSYSIGTTLNFGPSGRFSKQDGYLIYEADEFDRNFLKFQPYISLITSLDYDHPDTYPSRENYQQAFMQFLIQSDHCLIWDRDATVLVQATDEKTDIITYKDYANAKRPNRLGLELAGEHNRAHASLVCELAVRFLGMDRQTVVEQLNQYPGSGRRFERIRRNLVSDYAHHPTEIAATIKLARELNDDVVVVYQPHQNVRQHQLLDSGAYRGVFEGASKVYWLPTYLSREDPKLAILTPERLLASAGQKPIFEAVQMDPGLADKINRDLSAGKLVLAMSAGDLDEWLRRQFVPRAGST